MKIARLAVLACLTLAACASDRGKEARHAETNLTNEQMRVRNDEARLADRQARERAAAERDRSMSADDRAEHARTQEEERADHFEDNERALAGAKKDVTSAHADLKADRASTTAEAQARLAKTDAKLKEARSKGARLSAAKRTKLDSNVSLYDRTKRDVKARIDALPERTAADWDTAKAKLDEQLDALEDIARRFDDDL